MHACIKNKKQKRKEFKSIIKKGCMHQNYKKKERSLTSQIKIGGKLNVNDF